jgi:hypothetical protein
VVSAQSEAALGKPLARLADLRVEHCRTFFHS